MCSCKHTAINECEIKEKHSNSENSKTKSVFSFGMTFITLLFSAIRKTVFNIDNIKSSNVISEEMYEIEIPIIIEKNLATYEYDSFARGYNAYMYGHLESSDRRDIKTQPRANKRGGQKCSRSNAINSLGKESVIGHIPQSISKFSSVFLMILPLTSVEVEVVSKRLNRGGGYGLEIPDKYCFLRSRKDYPIIKNCQKKS